MRTKGVHKALRVDSRHAQGAVRRPGAAQALCYNRRMSSLLGPVRAYIRLLDRFRRHALSASAWRTRVVFWGGAFTVGALAALIAIASEYANEAFHLVIARSLWFPFAISPLGLMFVLWLTRRFFPGSEGSGIPQAIAALRIKGSAQRLQLLSVRIALGKILLTFLGLLSGASIGREGPTVHVGASIMFYAGRIARFPRHEMERGLILAGGAAGIAAAFNTPIAGIIFAIEEMSRSFEQRSSGTLLIAVIVSGVTAVALLGNYTYFGSTNAALSPGAWALVPLCGIVGGFAGGTFSVILINGSRMLAPWMRRYPYVVAAGCGLALATIGWLSGGTAFGSGYHEARGIVTESAQPALLYPVWKLLASAVSYLSGIPGGIFAPSLATGAGIGADLAHWFPSAPIAAAIVLGMVSYLSGAVQTPITAFVIVMEVTDNHAMLFPLMAASFIAYGTSRLVCQEAVYRELAKRFVPVPGQDADADEPDASQEAPSAAEAEADAESESLTASPTGTER